MWWIYDIKSVNWTHNEINKNIVQNRASWYSLANNIVTKKNEPMCSKGKGNGKPLVRKNAA